ncbi:copper resistance CopC family protein [Dactylosporangium sp. NPDC000555]|uniref:copper resistance CopC family protein n=1 Tax=Dactylosporangium sp. NPDC000555 TaxID=3154260 RepID=UPI003318A489
MRLPATARAALAATAAALLVTLLPARPAWAHERLLSSDPADGASVTTPVTAVTLTFNAPVKSRFSTVVVTGADGAGHAQGAPRAVDATLVQAVGALPPGTVRVAWRTVSADGHPIEGQFTFTNAAPPPASAAASPSPAAAESATAASSTGASSTAADPPASGGQDSPAPAWWWIVAAVVLVPAAAGGWLWSRRRRGAGG